MAPLADGLVSAPTAADDAAAAGRSRRFPLLCLFALVILFLSAGSGVALSVIVVLFRLEAPDDLDLPSRIVLFAASCLGLLYVVLHAVASRKSYTKGHGLPQQFGQFLVGVAYLLARLSLLAWIGAVVMTALVAARRGLDFARGVEGNAPWLGLLVAVLGLLSAAAILGIIELSDRPFATAGLSRASCIREQVPDPSDTITGTALSGVPTDETQETGLARRRTLTKPAPWGDDSQDTQVLVTKHVLISSEKSFGSETSSAPSGSTASDSTGSSASRGGRTQPLPTPLDNVFSPLPHHTYSDKDSTGAFAWRPAPPRRDLENVRQSGITSFDQLSPLKEGEATDNSSLVARTSVVSSLSSDGGRALEPTIPRISIISNTESSATSPRFKRASVSKRDSILVRELDLDTRRWTGGSMEAAVQEAGKAAAEVFVDVPLPAREPRNMGELSPRPPLARQRSMSLGAAVTNFSRPRTAAAALMQEKVEKRLQQAAAMSNMRGPPPPAASEPREVLVAGAARQPSVRREVSVRSSRAGVGRYALESRESVSTVGTSILEGSRPASHAASWRTRRSTYSFQAR